MRGVIAVVISVGGLGGFPAWAAAPPSPQQQEGGVTVIYRKADRKVAGWVRPPQSVEQEMANLTKSELGGTTADYATSLVSEAAWAQRHEQLITVTPTGQVVFAPDPDVEAQRAAERSARAKLTALGFTDPELEAVFER
jgi:hypothetical protein